jgi:hypothetical protein
LIPGPEQQGQIFPFLLQKTEEAVVWGHLGSTVRLDGEWVTTVGVQDGLTDLSLRWFQRGSYEVFSISATAASVGLLVGDIDGNGHVAFQDFLILSANFGSTMATAGEGDLDGDGQIAFSDFLMLSTNFGKSTASVASVPEPTCRILIMVGTLSFVWLRRRHGFR